MTKQENWEMQNQDIKSKNKSELVKEIVSKIGSGGDARQALALMTELGITDMREREEMATFIKFELESARQKKLYDYLKETGREGIIIHEGEDGDEIIGDYKQELLKKEKDEEGVVVTYYKIIMDGKIIGRLKIEDDDGYISNIFEPGPGVTTYQDYEIKKEMEAKQE